MGHKRGGHRRTGKATSNEGGSEGVSASMTQISSVVAQNEKAMQQLLENYRRGHASVPLWLSHLPYYKKDALIVVNMRNDAQECRFVVPAADESSSRSPVEKVKDTAQNHVSAINAAQQVKIERAVPSSSSKPREGESWKSVAQRADHVTEPPPPQRTEITYVSNAVNVSGAEKVTQPAPVEGISIVSDPLWSNSNAEATSWDAGDMQSMLSKLIGDSNARQQPEKGNEPREKPSTVFSVTASPLPPVSSVGLQRTAPPIPMQQQGLPSNAIPWPYPQAMYTIVPQVPQSQHVIPFAPAFSSQFKASPIPAHPPQMQLHMKQAMMSPQVMVHGPLGVPHMHPVQQYQQMMPYPQQITQVQPQPLPPPQNTQLKAPSPPPAPQHAQNALNAQKINVNARPFTPMQESRLAQQAFNVGAAPFVPSDKK